MNKDLDSIRTTISLSFGTKNKLRNLMCLFPQSSYEDIINHLIIKSGYAKGIETFIKKQ